MNMPFLGQSPPSEAHSQHNLNAIGEILNRKTSVAQIMSKTVEGLNHAYELRDSSPEDLIFDLFKMPNKDEASISKLIKVLKSFGLRESDPRLRHMMEKMKSFEDDDDDARNFLLSRDKFKECIHPSVQLISQALRNHLIIPSWGEFCGQIKTIFEECRLIKEGSVATYIPQLARQNPDIWGLSICTIDGQRVSFGDYKMPFCVQSVSKAFNYAIVSSDLGADFVHSYVGHEPSGRLFNEICLDANGKFLSERDTADRNYALSYYMKENKCFPPGTQVGLPAKSGVSGVMIVVVPNLMGIALFAPPLDKMGNSTRGVAFCQKLIETFNFHNYDSLLHADSKKHDPRRRIGNRDTELVVSLLFAAKNGDFEVVRRMYLQGTNLEMADYDGRTALHVAAAEGHMHLVKFFVNVAKVNHQPRDRFYLISSARRGLGLCSERAEPDNSLEIVFVRLKEPEPTPDLLLCENNTNQLTQTDILKEWGRTPLDDARAFHHEDCIRFLLKQHVRGNRSSIPNDVPGSENCIELNSQADESSGEEELAGTTGVMLINESEVKEKVCNGARRVLPTVKLQRVSEADDETCT
ncbi:glutaminase [Ancylostoma caninum]|uniref:glutaminase n=1 Tax=Ancylostoma caninum TaxID=29170 RepID=A0A368FPF6_ANCCA|nr:glutaminase [Ancylostoma caninum]